MNVEVISLLSIIKFFKDHKFQKGDEKFESNYALEFKITDNTITAKIKASLKDSSYEALPRNKQ